ncbi:MAG: hypothetical protein GC191_21020 [Azospirillum sp.]|nr:hypothetical protein [Azospirillum sp.]
MRRIHLVGPQIIRERVVSLELGPTTAERLDEVAAILAAGIRRAQARRLESQAKSKGNTGESCLDISVKQSGHVPTKTRRGEKT